MADLICKEGHVMGASEDACSRCGCPAVSPESFIGEDTEILTRDEAKAEGIDVEKVEEEAVSVEAPEEVLDEEVSESENSEDVAEEAPVEEAEDSNTDEA